MDEITIIWSRQISFQRDLIWSDLRPKNLVQGHFTPLTQKQFLFKVYARNNMENLQESFGQGLFKEIWYDFEL